MNVGKQCRSRLNPAAKAGDALRYARLFLFFLLFFFLFFDFFLIRVADSGCGIPEQYRESIFQPFFRVDKSRSRENGGVGLGLSLVWEIAALHGGDVRVEESSESGTAITVRLPI